MPTPAADVAPAPPAKAPARDKAAPEARPDVGEAAKEAPASPPSGTPGILPEPDFKLAGPDLKAPTSAPADGDSQPKLLDLDLKKE